MSITLMSMTPALRASSTICAVPPRSSPLGRPSDGHGALSTPSSMDDAQARSPFFRGGVLLPAVAMAAQGLRVCVGALPARRQTGSTEQRDTAQRMIV